MLSEESMSDSYFDSIFESIIINPEERVQFNELIELVRKNCGNKTTQMIDGKEVVSNDMSKYDALRFLYLVETYEAGGHGICNYAAAVNMIFNKYIGKEAQFEIDFGYPMYVTNKQGNKVLNDKMLLVDMYSIINKDVFVKKVDAKYSINTKSINYLKLSDEARFKMEYLQKFLDTKGVKLVIKEKFFYSSEKNIMWKEELILKIKESLENGEYINISGHGLDILYKDGSINRKDCGGHIMTLVGLMTDGKAIVDSWGLELAIDLEKTLEHIGEKYNPNSKLERSLKIATYEFIEE